MAAISSRHLKLGLRRDTCGHFSKTPYEAKTSVTESHRKRKSKINVKSDDEFFSTRTACCNIVGHFGDCDWGGDQ